MTHQDRNVLRKIHIHATSQWGGVLRRRAGGVYEKAISSDKKQSYFTTTDSHWEVHFGQGGMHNKLTYSYMSSYQWLILFTDQYAHYYYKTQQYTYTWGNNCLIVWAGRNLHGPSSELLKEGSYPRFYGRWTPQSAPQCSDLILYP